jgi:predicted nucleotidyltransferase
LFTGDADMDRVAILERLKAEAPALREKYRLASLAVFGSMARGDNREGSDVDILVTFEGKADFDRFMGLKLDLEDRFGRRVDLGTPDTLRPEMRAEVERDLFHVPSRGASGRRHQAGGIAMDPLHPGIVYALNDTDPRVEVLLIEGYRGMSPSQKLERVRALTRAVQELALLDIRRRHPDADERELALRLASRWIDPELMVRAFGWDVRKVGY